MRLVHAPDGTVDRYDRAVWLTLPFDLAFTSVLVTGPFHVEAAQILVPGARRGEVLMPGARRGEVLMPGAQTGGVQ
jgi:hypothetical protein